MNKSFSMLIVLVFLSTSCLVPIKSVHSASDGVENSWTSKAPMNEARSSLGVAVVNGKIYAIGGRNGRLGTGDNIGFVGTNEEYNPTTDTWTVRTPMPTPRAYLAVATYEKKIYCIGGINLENGEYVALGTNEVYDPATDMWETKASLPTPSLGVTASVVNGRIFIVGGGSNVVEVYDPAADSWSEAAPIPVAPEAFYYGSCVSAVVNGEIHVIGAFPLENSHQVYDTNTDSWIFGKPLVAGYYYAASVATTGANAFRRIYVFGADSQEWYPDSPEITSQTYDPKTESWMVTASMPTGRLNVGVAILNDELYVIGGGTPGVKSGDHPSEVNEVYTPFGYGMPDPSYSPSIDNVAPEIRVLSPENKSYYGSDVLLNVTVNEQGSWTRYKLDGGNVSEITKNTTLTGLTYGSHNITVYSTDPAGNTATSQTIQFTITKETEPFPTLLVATVSVVSIAIIGISLLVYFKKRKHLIDPRV